MTREHAHSALQHYFDDLLLEPAPAPAEEAEPRPRPVAEPETDLQALEASKRAMLQALLDRQAPPAEAPVATPAPEVTEPRVLAPEVTEPRIPDPEPPAAPEVATVDDSETVSRYLEWHENGRPHWAQERFDALLFEVSGLTLAVPLIALGQIQPLTDELTPLFGQADWFMGLLPTPAGQVRVVNTALFVMPEKYDPAFTQTARYVVSIDGVPWALAVDAVNQPVSLAPEDVKWRGERAKRPWLAGTVRSAMCALIDIPRMGQMLVEADQRKTR